MSSDPASEFGHNTIAGILSSRIASKVSVICFSAFPYSVVTGCCETKRKLLFNENLLPTPLLNIKF